MAPSWGQAFSTEWCRRPSVGHGSTRRSPSPPSIVAPPRRAARGTRGPSLRPGPGPSASARAEWFFRTGDLGYFDEHGCLHFALRLKDVIKTAGVNVAAVEVEEALARHPAVKAAHVVGVPHVSQGENVAAFVVRHPGAEATAAELETFCREWPRPA